MKLATLGWDTVDQNSWWIGGAIFAPGNRAKVEAAYRDELDRVRRDGFTEKELAEGKQGLLSFRSLSRAQDGNLAAGWARNLNLGRPFAEAGEIDQRLQQLTLAQVNDALRDALREDADDLAAFEERAAEPEISYEALLKDLRAHGKL